MQSTQTTNVNIHFIDASYNISGLYPTSLQKENVIISASTTMDFLERYCINNRIKPFDKQSIDALVAVAMAAKMGNITLLKKLVKKIGIEILNTCDNKHYTPLHIICYETTLQGCVYKIRQLCKGAQKLIELGANPNIPTLEGFTPLSIAASKAKNNLLTRLLIQNHAKLTSSVSQLLEYDPETGFLQIEPKIRANILEEQKVRARPFIVLLYLAAEDRGSRFSVFPREIFKIIAHLFWKSMTYQE